jgi:hypothetical protein
MTVLYTLMNVMTHCSVHQQHLRKFEITQLCCSLGQLLMTLRSLFTAQEAKYY